jgi:acyl carrier protein
MMLVISMLPMSSQTISPRTSLEVMPSTLREPRHRSTQTSERVTTPSPFEHTQGAMTMPSNDEILAKLDTIFQDILDDDELRLSPETTARDVENWDSLSHVRLMLTVEKSFGVKFSAAEIGRLKNVGSLVTLLQDRLSR